HQLTSSAITYSGDYQIHADIVDNVITGKSDAGQFEKRYVCKDGKLVWAKLTVSAIQDQDGRVYGIAIVENHDAQKQIHDRLHLLEMAVEHTKDAVIISAVGGHPDNVNPRVLYANKAFEDLSGYPVAEIIGKTPDLLHRIVNANAEPEKIREAYLQKKPIDLEAINYRKDGTSFWVGVSVTPILSENGAVTNWVGILRDVTERKQAEEKLRQNRVLLEAVFDQSVDALLVVDKKTDVILDCNENAVTLFNAGNKLAMIGKPGLSLQKSLPSQEEAAKIYEQLGRAGIWKKEFEFRQGNRERQWMNIAIKLVNVEGVELYLIRLQDVTSRKLAEEVIRENEKRYRTLVANIPGVVYRCKNDDYWTMDFISEAIFSISGYPADEFIENSRRSFASIVHPEDVEPIRTFINASLKARQPFELEYRIMHRDGRFRWVYEKGQAIFDQQGKVLWLDGVIIDATEMKRAEEAKIEVQIIEEHAREMTLVNEVLEKEVRDRKQTEIELYKKNAMLRAMADAARMLLTTEDLNASIIKALGLLGSAADVDRVYIVENHQHPLTGDMLMSIRYEWARRGRVEQVQYSDWQNLPYQPNFSRWYEVLSKGAVISGLIEDFTKSERWLLEDREVVSVLIAPIMIGNAFWGFIGFEDCRSQHNWGSSEDIILSVTAGTIGEAIARRKM
ncbi:MAG: PAS domain S-box protein, partial [Chlorobiales bacterium]|nr:PAS domain S-box protein [Chlorobiales bacterium]